MIKYLHNMFLLTLVFICFSCANQSQTSKLPEQSHGKSAEPNYSIVFPNNKVNRIDIKIDKKLWLKMNTDLEANLQLPHRGKELHPAHFSANKHKIQKRQLIGNRPDIPFRRNGSFKGSSMENDKIYLQGRIRNPGIPGSHPGRPPDGKEFNPIWAYCDVEFNNHEWSKVGIHFKGNSSLRSTYQMGLKKFSFKLDFDQFEDKFPEVKNQRFYGFKQLNLKNNYDDLSFIREKLAADLFAEFGLVTPKTSFCKLYVDYGQGSRYFGLYTLVEEVDDTVIETHYESENGNLYKPDGFAATFAKDSYNSVGMNKKNNKKIKDFTDVKLLNTVLNSSLRITNYERWKLQLNEIFDVPVFLKYLAANNVMQNWDSYGNTMHNYYLFHNTLTSKLEWIPWDNNEAFQSGKMGGALSLSLNEVGDNWPLIRYIINDEEWRSEYINYVSVFIQDIFSPEKMDSIISGYRQLIASSAIGGGGEQSPYSFLQNDQEFIEAFEFFKSYVLERQAVAHSFIQKQNF